jgi:nucleotide-binding universal stress UspA family protein
MKTGKAVMKILLAVDPPEQCNAAIKTVAGRPWPPNSIVDVLSVVEPSFVLDVPSLVKGLQEAAEGTARSAADQLRSSGLNATACVLCGDAKAVIVDHARAVGADFVVVGSRGMSGLTRFLLGSVAAAVARFAPCSVEIVRAAPADEPRRTAMKILLATDGSECSQLAARSIAERPWPAGSEFRVVSVPELSAPVLQMISHRAMDKLPGDAMKRAEDAETAAAEIRRAPVSRSLEQLLHRLPRRRRSFSGMPKSGGRI